MANTTHRVIASIGGLNVRSGPGTTYSILGALTTGEEVTVTSVATDWAKIDGPRLYGYSYYPYLEPIPGTPGTGEVVIYYRVVAPEGISVKLVPSDE